EIRSELEVLAKLFWITVIIRMPGARKCENGTPPTGGRPAPSASVNTIMKRDAVATGAASVCDQTLVNRCTSRNVSVQRPSQLKRPNLRTPNTGRVAAALACTFVESSGITPPPFSCVKACNHRADTYNEARPRSRDRLPIK